MVGNPAKASDCLVVSGQFALTVQTKQHPKHDRKQKLLNEIKTIAAQQTHQLYPNILKMSVTVQCLMQTVLPHRAATIPPELSIWHIGSSCLATHLGETRDTSRVDWVFQSDVPAEGHTMHRVRSDSAIKSLQEVADHRHGGKTGYTPDRKLNKRLFSEIPCM